MEALRASLEKKAAPKSGAPEAQAAASGAGGAKPEAVEAEADARKPPRRAQETGASGKKAAKK
jgi:hypothetical protein